MTCSGNIDSILSEDVLAIESFMESHIMFTGVSDTERSEKEAKVFDKAVSDV